MNHLSLVRHNCKKKVGISKVLFTNCIFLHETHLWNWLQHFSVERACMAAYPTEEEKYPWSRSLYTLCKCMGVFNVITDSDNTFGRKWQWQIWFTLVHLTTSLLTKKWKMFEKSDNLATPSNAGKKQQIDSHPFHYFPVMNNYHNSHFKFQGFRVYSSYYYFFRTFSNSSFSLKMTVRLREVEAHTQMSLRTNSWSDPIIKKKLL